MSPVVLQLNNPKLSTTEPYAQAHTFNRAANLKCLRTDSSVTHVKCVCKSQYTTMKPQPVMGSSQAMPR